MTKPATIGGLWIAAALFALAITFVFRVDQTQMVVTVALALAAIALGVWLLIRTSHPATVASIVLGVAWTVVYIALSVVQADEPAALVTDAFLAALGLLGAGLGWVSRRRGPSGAQARP